MPASLKSCPIAAMEAAPPNVEGSISTTVVVMPRKDRRAKASMMVTGAVFKSGNSIRIDYQINDVSSTKLVKAGKVAGLKDGYRFATEAEIVATFGTSHSGSGGGLPATTSPKTPAIAWYSAASLSGA